MKGLNIAGWLFSSPILLAPRFGLDDSEHADFDATLVLATMLGSQLGEEESSEIAPSQVAVNQNMLSKVKDTALHNSLECRTVAQNSQRAPILSTKSTGEQSDHTKVWSEISGINQTKFTGRICISLGSQDKVKYST
jgi:cell cycle checkpoint control protein RAD9A